MKSDPERITLAMFVACTLASCKDLHFLPRHIGWQLNTYTMWNISMLLVRYFLSVPEWDPFLCVNSVGVCMGFRTAFNKGLDDNIRKKMQTLGFDISRRHFVMADHLVHSAPACLMLYKMTRDNRRIPIVSATYAFTLMSWFAFRQAAQYDASGVYVPHPWKRGWLAAITAMYLTPHLVSSLQRRRHLRALLVCIIISFPYISTALDPDLKRRYDMEYALSKLNAEEFKDDEKRKIPKEKSWKV